nr:AMP-binding protein [Paracoccus versutus]
MALIDGARHIGYDRLHRDALALAGGLAALGLVRGHRVVVQFPNRAEFVTLFFALCRLGWSWCWPCPAIATSRSASSPISPAPVRS